MLPQQIIHKKRDGGTLTQAEIAAFIEGVTSGRVSEGQIAAFCMSVFFRGMNLAERVALTSSMASSGTRLSWDLPGPVIDKHSTGGVGDKVSLVLAPIVAACGVFVPMLAGRGLGHTGGTFDKMEAIPGYRTQPDLAAFKKVVKDVGCAIIGATPELAPADRTIYAIRDVTATVESLDLITASILSKKLAAGLNGLVMDVTCGSGAFLKDMRALAESLVTVGRSAGLPMTALLTDMNQVLGRTAGNAVEVREAIDYLADRNRDPRLHEVTMALAAEMLLLGGIADGRAKAEAALVDGRAAARFAQMVAALGGPADLLEKPEKYLRTAPVVLDVYAPEEKGFVVAQDVYAIGMGIVELGGGRARPDEKIDHAVGLTNVIQIGEDAATRPLATVHAHDAVAAAHMAEVLISAVTLGAKPAVSASPIRERIGA